MRILDITSGVNLHRRCPGEISSLPTVAGQKGDLEVKREGILVAEPDTKTKRPPFYRVIMLNDDYTPMEFVVQILKNLFHKTHEDAIHIMLSIHHHGTGLCGLYTRDVAETKVEQVIQYARQNEHPLQCIMERE